jgi:RNA 2',3'-cyclic 3'-phosphodiesterase
VTDQFSLFAPPAGPAPVPKPRASSGARRHELFFALQPAAQDAKRVAARAAAESGRLAIGGKALEPERLHVSLRAMGDYCDVFPVSDVGRWMAAAACVRMAPFDIVFDRVATFGGIARPLVFKAGAASGVVGVRRLSQALGMALADAGEHVTARGFEPHMTISYQGAATAETSIEPVGWTACDFVLIDSHYGAHLYDVIGRWPLQA